MCAAACFFYGIHGNRSVRGCGHHQTEEQTKRMSGWLNEKQYGSTKWSYRFAHGLISYTLTVPYLLLLPYVLVACERNFTSFFVQACRRLRDLYHTPSVYCQTWREREGKCERSERRERHTGVMGDSGRFSESSASSALSRCDDRSKSCIVPRNMGKNMGHHGMD